MSTRQNSMRCTVLFATTLLLVCILTIHGISAAANPASQASTVPLAIQNRIEKDLARAREELKASRIPEITRDSIAQNLDSVKSGNGLLVDPPGDDYRAIFPLTDTHAMLFAAMGKLRGTQGRPRLELWKNNRWERLSLWSMPPEEGNSKRVSLQIRMMKGERRADTVNIANNSSDTTTAQVWMSGLPGGTRPKYVSVREVEYIALPRGGWDADALPEAAVRTSHWEITLPAGISRQLWVSFQPGKDVKPGNYRGKLVIAPRGGKRLTVPVELTVEPFQYPQEHTLAFGMWDYTNGSGYAGIKPGNISVAVAHMRSYGYNVPWATSGAFPSWSADHFDSDDNLVRKPDWSHFDAWISMWPGARYYAIFPNVGTSYAGAAMGTEQFNRRLGTAMTTWADHLRELKIEPGLIMLLLVDEPGLEPGGAAEERLLLWAKAIKTAVPEFKLFTDPLYPEPHKVGFKEMFEIHDVICPHTAHYDAGGKEFRDFYENLRAGGRQLFLYICNGGPGSVEAIAYYRAQQWKLWSMKGTGTMFWSYGDTGGAQSSWNTLSATSEIYTPVYLDSNSVTDGKHWLAIIEGIQDYEYLNMLKKMLSQLPTSVHEDDTVVNARNLLNTLSGEVIASVNAGDINACDNGRLRVMDALLEISRILKTRTPRK